MERQNGFAGDFQEGLRRMSRLYVHLSATPEIAQTVGARHGKPVVLRVQTGKMAEDGYAFTVR